MKRVFFIALLSALFISYAAWADLDQRCLKLCHDNGIDASKCLMQCTYDPAPLGTATIGPHAVGDTHRVFNAPVPTSQIMVPTSTSSLSPQSGKDYQCVQQCLHDGGQYQLCSDHCMMNTCPPGSFECKDIRGIAPKAVMPPPTVPISTALPGSNKGYQPPGQ